MPRVPLAAVLAFGALAAGQRPVRTVPPSYSETSIVNSIHAAAPLSPNSFATISGTDLSWNTREVADADLRAGFLPTELGGVRVLLDNLPAHLLSVSPERVKFLVPGALRPKIVQIWILRDGTEGPRVRIPLVETSPVLLTTEDVEIASAAHLDAGPVTPAEPARPGGYVVFYAAGLGPAIPPQIAGKIPQEPAEIAARADLVVFWGGEPVLDIYYAGVTPGSAGLYQINVRLPDASPVSPTVRISLGGRSSAELRLPFAP